MSKRIVVVLAEGFEEIEAIAPVDIWRRLGFEVVLAGLDSVRVTGAHRISIMCDVLLSEVEVVSVCAVFLPGGMPGSENLKNSDAVISFLRGAAANENVIIAAICAAPIVLGKAGIVDQKKITCYPGFEDQITAAKYTAALTEIDGRILTGKGPGAAFALARNVAEALGEGDEMDQLAKGMFID